MANSIKSCKNCNWSGEVHNRTTLCPACGLRALGKKATEPLPIPEPEEEEEEEIRYHCDAVLTVSDFPHRHYCTLSLGHEDQHESVSGVVW